MIITAGIQQFARDHAYSREPGFPYWTLEVTTSGSMARMSGRLRTPQTQPNHALILIPPNTPYSLHGIESGRESWLIFRPREEWMPYLSWPGSAFEVPVLALSEGDPLIVLVEQACQTFAQDRPEHKLLANNALERLILQASLSRRSAPARSTDSRIEQATARMQECFEEPIRVPDLAAAVHLSPSRFAHLFRTVMGVAPIQYLENLRMEKAEALLLRTDLTVEAVAREVGFEDAAYFSTRFRRHHGRPPSRWRRSPDSPDGVA